ncbi:hypothetical protein ACXWTF_09360 [Thiomicrolovo sp. ZZH C-3]
MQTIDPALQTLELQIETVELPENNETAVMLKTDDGQDITSNKNIVWHISDTNVTEINGTKLFANAEGSATVRAEVDGEYSQEQNVTVYKIIHGHRLPPEPDPKINNSTLLGVDSNDNGVRDDVERWTILKYKEKHPIVTLIGLQGARAAQIIIQEPEKGRETRHIFKKAQYCSIYFKSRADYYGEPLLIDEFMWGDDFNNIQFNTTQRARAYAIYNVALSGGVYSAPTSQEMRNQCDFNVLEMLKNGQ